MRGNEWTSNVKFIVASYLRNLIYSTKPVKLTLVADPNVPFEKTIFIQCRGKTKKSLSLSKRIGGLKLNVMMCEFTF